LFFKGVNEIATLSIVSFLSRENGGALLSTYKNKQQAKNEATAAAVGKTSNPATPSIPNQPA